MTDWDNPHSKVSIYFKVYEVTNNDSRRIPRDPKVINNIMTLARKLDTVRKEWGSPIIVTSWYRPAEINKLVGGARFSQHIQGSAADIKPANGKLVEFEKWLDNGLWKNMALGYGANKGFVHVDLRPSRIRWRY